MRDLRSRITGVARELFLREGTEGFTMRRIADRVGVTPPAIYRHFRDKNALLDEIIGAGLLILEDYLKPALRLKDPYERLRGLIEAYLDFALEQPKYFELAFLVPSPGGLLSKELERANRQTFRLAVEQIAECMQRGIFRRADPLDTAVLLWATAHGLVTFHRMERLGLDEKKFRLLYRRTIETALEGLKPPRGEGR